MKTFRYSVLFLLLPMFATAQTSDTLHIDAYAEEVRLKEQVLDNLHYKLQAGEGIAVKMDSLRNSFTSGNSVPVSPPVDPQANARKKTETLPDYLAEINRRKRTKKIRNRE